MANGVRWDEKPALRRNAVQLSNFLQDVNGIALRLCFDGPIVLSIGPFVIQEANQPFSQMLHGLGHLAVGPGDRCPMKLELDHVQCSYEAYFGRLTFDR